MTECTAPQYRTNPQIILTQNKGGRGIKLGSIIKYSLPIYINSNGGRGVKLGSIIKHSLSICINSTAPIQIPKPVLVPQREPEKKPTLSPAI